MKTFLLFTLLCLSIFPQTFRIKRPIAEKFEVNGSYLYAEPRIYDNTKGHTGIDVRIAYDTVYSATDGYVDFVGYNPNDTVGGYDVGGAGNYVKVNSMVQNVSHNFYYMHLHHPIAVQGNNVKAGDLIGISGNTGYSTGPHLHFEIRRADQSSRNRRNPELWMSLKGMGAIYGYVPNAGNSTRVDISPYPKPKPPYTTYGYSLTYNFADPGIGSDDVYKENYAIGDVKPGTYTITSINGYRRTVTVKAGEIVNADAVTSVEDEYIVNGYELFQNYPNPFNPYTNISFSLPKEEFVELKIYNMLGEEKAILINDILSAGKHTFTFDATGLPSGVYVYILTTSNYSKSMKMILAK